MLIDVDHNRDLGHTLTQNLTVTQNLTMTQILTLTQNSTLTKNSTLTQIDFVDKGFIIKTVLWAFFVCHKLVLHMQVVFYP